MSVTSAWIRQRQDVTGLDYRAIAPQLETLDAARNPNDAAQNQKFLQAIFETTDQHEIGKQLPIAFAKPGRR